SFSSADAESSRCTTLCAVSLVNDVSRRYERRRVTNQASNSGIHATKTMIRLAPSETSIVFHPGSPIRANAISMPTPDPENPISGGAIVSQWLANLFDAGHGIHWQRAAPVFDETVPSCLPPCPPW